MWKLAFIFALLCVSVSPLDARESGARDGKGSELRRDVDRISKEIYPSPPARSEPAPRPSFAAGRAPKKR